MKLQVSNFKLDVTPPTGAQMAYCINREVDSPIFIRGIILDDGEARAVILACDFIYVHGNTWYEWRKIVADSAGTIPGRVFLHSVHQHDSMRITPEWNPLLAPFGEVFVDENYCSAVADRLRQTVSKAVSSGWREVGQILTAERRMWGLASNRRIVNASGQCYAMRYSQCRDDDLKALPVGVIDPFLRTLAFGDQSGQVVAALHSYASHPMAAYMREKVGADVPGVALDFADKYCKGEPHNLYLTGCGGNVTFGKYHLGDKEKSLEVLGERLGAGMSANLNCLEPVVPGGLSFAEESFEFPLKPGLEKEQLRERVEKGLPDGSPDRNAIIRLVALRNWDKWRHCTVFRMTLADGVHFLSLPGEMCVEYQLYAQSLVPEQFLMCAAYGNGSYHYIPTAQMFAEGGYEPEEGSFTTSEVEPRLKKALTDLLSDVQT